MLNPLLVPTPGTFHWNLTQTPVDLSPPQYNKRTCTRAKLLEFLAGIIKMNPDVVSFMFARTGSKAHVTVTLTAGEIFRIHFSLISRERYDDLLGGYDRLNDRDYLTLMLQQESYIHRVDYSYDPGFAYS
jgi:hypothetical protein